MSITDKFQHLISETEHAGNVLRTYATVLANDDRGVVGLQFSTTYSGAKNPDEHRVTHTQFFTSAKECNRFVGFLNQKLFL